MTETAAITDPEVQRLLGEATAWRLLGLLFERPRGGWWQEVEMLSPAVADPEIRAAADAAREGANESLYLALLGPGGPISLREVTYRGMEDPGHIIADIRAFYEAFMFHPETEEAPDHLAVEAGFLGYLCLKEAYARARGTEDEAEVAAQAVARFCEEHLSPLAWPAAERLAEADVRYLSLAAAALARRSGPRSDARTTVEEGSRFRGNCHLECGLE
jgi:nitrate reductase assembly molybdenum cofactor insertion protein NarJ